MTEFDLPVTGGSWNVPPARVVSTHNDWDPLEEVIVGRIGRAAHPSYEPSLRALFPGPAPRGSGPVLWDRRQIDSAEAQLDGLARVLRAEGVVVRRPPRLDHVVPVRTPRYEAPAQNSATCPRDSLLVVGDQIIEAPMAVRSRSFEYLPYREIVRDYFRQGARWVSAPRPALGEAAYSPDFGTDGLPFDADANPALTELEPCFDAASFVRVGRDLFYQPDLVTNDVGAQWVARHLGPEYRVHRTLFSSGPAPMHMDTTLVPLRPGLVMVNPERPPLDDTLRLFEKNGWDVVPGVTSMSGAESPSAGSSNWISINVLCLDERTVVCEERESGMIKLLERRGFRVIALPFREVYPFGGGFHCCVLDVRRRGSLQSYFPSLDG